MIGRGGAAGQQQFSQRDGGGQFQIPRSQPGPDRIQILQPGKQRNIDHGRPGTGQGLVEVMVRVDQSGQDDVVAGLKHLVVRRRRGLPGGNQFDDSGAFDDDSTTGVVLIGGKNGLRVAQPGASGFHGSILRSMSVCDTADTPVWADGTNVASSVLLSADPGTATAVARNSSIFRVGLHHRCSARLQFRRAVPGGARR